MSKNDLVKIANIADVFCNLKPAKTIVTAMAAAEPQLFWSHIQEYSNSFEGLRIYCANPSKTWPLFLDEAKKDHLEIVVMFLTTPIRKLQGRGFVHYMPQHLSQWSRNLVQNSRGVDVFWGTCSAPDERGFVSLGSSNCYESEVLRAAKKVVLEMNPHMPKTSGATEVATHEVDYFLSTENLLPTVIEREHSASEAKIADYIMDLIPDGATIQLGIGGIPNAVGRRLKEKKDLGVHTEMINDAMMNLYRDGVITGGYKTIWPRKIVGAFAFGSKELYQFIDGNPVVELHPASVVNDPYRIGRNHKMISLNTAVEIDLTGQVCSESIGHLELSGVGGAFETHVGAQRSEGGRGIIALLSTSKNDAYSKIVSSLNVGAKVSISRNDIDTVVTEFGIAELRGKTVPERIRALVKISHPKFRDQLFEDAKKFDYI